MTFTLDSRKFEYVDQPSSGTATPAKRPTKSEAANDAKEGRSDESGVETVRRAEGPAKP